MEFRAFKCLFSPPGIVYEVVDRHHFLRLSEIRLLTSFSTKVLRVIWVKFTKVGKITVTSNPVT